MKPITLQTWMASAVRRRKDGDWDSTINAETQAVGLLIISGPRSQQQAQQLADLAADAPTMADLLAECIPAGLSEARFSDWKAEVLRVFSSSGIADSEQSLIAARLA